MMHGRSERGYDDEYDPYASYPSYQEEYAQAEQGADGAHDYDQQQQYPPSFDIVPESVQRFVVQLQKAVHEQNVYEINQLYENTFNNLTERYYKTSPWPEPEYVSPICNDDQIFMILYKELYFRHIYGLPGGPNLDQRFASYFNYCSLFNYILNAAGPVPLELPNQWLWDIIDEFIYQFQSFSQYRSKLSKKTDDELLMLKNSPKIWNVHSVLNVLHSLVDKSNINKQLDVYSSGGDPSAVAGEYGCQPLYKMLGYFSLIGLLRLHSLLSDYYQAIKVLENIDLNKKSLYSRTVPSCEITTYYYVGFAYVMMRRYQDAIRTFCDALLYIQRTRQLHQHRYVQYDQMKKQTEQMYVLLCLTLVLHPMRIDESIHSHLKEKFGDKIIQLQKQDLQEYENSFLFACPKFLSPVPPNYDNPNANYFKEPFMQQLKVFLDEVHQQSLLNTIRSYLKLYTTMPIRKLSQFLNMDDEGLEPHLLCFKHKMKNVVCTKGSSGLEGEFQSASEVDFYIDKDMVHIADTKVARRYGDFFIMQIRKFEELNRNLQMIGQ